MTETETITTETETITTETETTPEQRALIEQYSLHLHGAMVAFEGRYTKAIRHAIAKEISTVFPGKVAVWVNKYRGIAHMVTNGQQIGEIVIPLDKSTPRHAT